MWTRKKTNPTLHFKFDHRHPLPMLAHPLRRILAAAVAIASPPLTRSLPFSTASARRRRRLSSMSVPVTAGENRSRRLRGVVFDMDGTLTLPVIDFPAMYRAVLGDDTYASMKESPIDILHHIETWGPEEQQRAYEAIARFEQEGLDRLQIMPGALELYRYLDSRNIRRGLITRNVKTSVDIFHQRFGMEFRPALSREFRPCKPDPAPLLHICTAWGVSPNEVLMVGDSLKDDVVCGNRAGAFTCLLDDSGRYGDADFLMDDCKPDFKVSSLVEVHSLLDTHFELLAHDQTSV